MHLEPQKKKIDNGCFFLMTAVTGLQPMKITDTVSSVDTVRFSTESNHLIPEK